jgi:hypothetical protein
LPCERLGHVVGGDRLGEALDDGGLADAGLADEHRVVLGAAAQHLHHPLGLTVATDDRVELLVAASWVRLRPNWSSTSEPDGVSPRPSGGGARLLARPGATLARAGVARQELDDLLAHPGQVGAELDQHLGGHALALADEAEEDVLGADVVVAELQRLAQRQLEHLLGAGVKGMWPDGDEPPWPMISSTWLRTPSREMPSDSSALAATPSPSWMSPSRMCSVPM